MQLKPTGSAAAVIPHPFHPLHLCMLHCSKYFGLKHSYLQAAFYIHLKAFFQIRRKFNFFCVCVQFKASVTTRSLSSCRLSRLTKKCAQFEIIMFHFETGRERNRNKGHTHHHHHCNIAE